MMWFFRGVFLLPCFLITSGNRHEPRVSPINPQHPQINRHLQIELPAPGTGPPCELCGPGVPVGNRSAVINALGMSGTCGELEDILLEGVLAEGQCAFISTVVDLEPCNCITEGPSVAPVTLPPVVPPGTFPPCLICGEGEQLANPNTDAGGSDTCAEIQENALEGVLDGPSCEAFVNAIQQVCLCEPIPPPTLSPVSPTQPPIPAPGTFPPCRLCEDGLQIENPGAIVLEDGTTCADVQVSALLGVIDDPACEALVDATVPICGCVPISSAPTTPAPITPVPTAPPSPAPTPPPTSSPISPTGTPTGGPTVSPTGTPSALPSSIPTEFPTGSPTPEPSDSPTGTPTALPTSIPTEFPTGSPTPEPSDSPVGPTTPSVSFTPSLSTEPSSSPSEQISSAPSEMASASPSSAPLAPVSSQPTGQPTSSPSDEPISMTTSSPSVAPVGISGPTRNPTPAPVTTTAVPSGANNQILRWSSMICALIGWWLL